MSEIGQVSQVSQVSQVLPPHHKHCDDLFAAAEEAAQQGDWARCGSALAGFALELRAHLAAEEAVLFPAFEAASGMKNGPTQMMRIEHEQMRELLGQLEAGLAAQDAEGFDGAAETLLILMQQHNMKEENILYPMCDRALAGDVGRVTDTLLTQLREAGCQLPR
jgi:iron-sulfur cluster repair protein YtfE (RIC family)